MHTEAFQSGNIWDKLAVVYRDKFMDLELYHDSYDFVCKALEKQHSTILDVGCGPGIIAKYLLSKRPDFRIHGIDSAPNMIALASELIPDATFQVLDCRDLLQLNAKYDAIVCGFCLPYLTPPEAHKMVADAVELLSTDGLFYLSFVEGDPNASGVRKSSTGDCVYFQYYNSTTVRDLLVEYGFINIRLFRVDYMASDGRPEIHVILVAVKGPKG